MFGGHLVVDIEEEDDGVNVEQVEDGGFSPTFLSDVYRRGGQLLRPKTI